MNVVLCVVDSLRARSLGSPEPGAPRTPFLERLGRETLAFRRAYATECWTLPAHLSMFTGLLPSVHRAHFQTMAYREAAPTIAEVLSAAGYHTAVLTRNTVFDGTMPGVLRGFAENRHLVAELGRVDPITLLIALAKPRMQRMIRAAGFFNALQKDRAFLRMTGRRAIPADRLVLDEALTRMEGHRRRGQPYFLFLNLYDVHAPYPPRAASPLRSFATPRGVRENLALPFLMAKIASHGYLRPGFRMSAWSRRMLLARYHRAIELMDRKLETFYDAARGAGLLDDTLFVLTADHGEAFGEHDLYLHDASVYDTNLRVPLWIHHPEVTPGTVEEAVSTRDLFTLLRAVGTGTGLRRTLLDPETRAASPVALAEHFHYPHTDGLLERYAQNIAAAIVGRRKVIVRREGLVQYDLAGDPDEDTPEPSTIAAFEAACRRDGIPAAAVAAAAAHLRRWETSAVAA